MYFNEDEELYYQKKMYSNYPDILSNFGIVRDYIIIRLVNPKIEGSMLGRMPGRPFLDLEVTYRILLRRAGGSSISINVDWDLLHCWDVDEKTLYSFSCANMQLMTDAHIWAVEDVIANGGLITGALSAMPTFPSVAEPDKLYVLTGSGQMNDAALICCSGLLNAFAKAVGGDFYVLPSSIREALLIRSTTALSPEMLKETLRTCNQNEVPPGEVLSDEVYYYSEEAGQLLLCG